MVTIKEVARRAKVSVGTVSNVISGRTNVSEKLRTRVLDAIRELDYHPNHVARSLKISRTKMLGMVISDITNPFFPEMARGAEDAALERGYLLITFNTDDRLDREEQHLAACRSRRLDGVLLVSAPNRGAVSHIERTIDAGIPIVCLDRVPPRISVDIVSVDNVRAARICTRHLLEMGYRDVAALTGSMELQTAADRLKGYKEALREAKARVNPDLIREGDFREGSGYRLTKELLLRRSKPSALFVSNGMMTLGVLRCLEEMRLRCPDDIGIATFDDLPYLSAFRPRLTAVAQPAYEIGYSGAELLIKRLEGVITDRKPVKIQLQAELKIRESSLGSSHRLPTGRRF